MFGPIFEPPSSMVLVRGEEPANRVELPALLPRALRGLAPQEAVRGSLIIDNGTLLARRQGRGKPFYSASSALDNLSGGALA